MSADLALQRAIRARLTSTTAVTDLVPALSILDRNSRPAPRPGIVLGETQEVDEVNNLSRSMTRIYHTIHIWKTEASREGVKIIAGAVRAAIKSDRLDLGIPYHCIDCHVSSVRSMSDPDGETSHATLVLNCLIEEVSG
jgi:hypothetical protein